MTWNKTPENILSDFIYNTLPIEEAEKIKQQIPIDKQIVLISDGKNIGLAKFEIGHGTDANHREYIAFIFNPCGFSQKGCEDGWDFKPIYWSKININLGKI
jgi:hypothetical protein